MPLAVWVAGASLWGPGLEGWEASAPVLRGEQPYVARESPPPPPAILPANERRRAGAVTRLALTVAGQAAAASGLEPAALRAVFGSSNGDGPVVHAILDELSRPGGEVSPTQFHNSVHNAAAGYWTIGAGSRRPASCLGCHDASFAAALLAAAAEARADRVPVLLVVYDLPLPAPLAAKRPTVAPLGVGLVLTPEPGPNSLAQLGLCHAAQPGEDAMPRDPGLRPLARGNPAGRGLRLLEALARGEADRFPLAWLDGRLDIEVTPCSTAPAS